MVTYREKTLDILSTHEHGHLVKSIELADTRPINCKMTSVDLLLGNDYYLDIAVSQKMEVLPGLILLCPKLGWILTGGVFY